MALFRHTANGAFTGEVWSFGIHTTGSLTVTGAEAAWATALGLFWSNADDFISDDVTVTETTTAELNQPTGQQITRVATPSSLVGASLAESLPFQCAPVVSLRTALATRAGRGRFYAPSLAVDQIASGKMVSLAQTGLLNGGVAMLQSLVGAGLTPVLYSRTTFQTQTITSVDVGDVIDTQRRRRNKLVEARVSANI